MAFLALMAGALFYAARLPMEQPATPPTASTPKVVKYPEFTLKDLDGNDRAFAEFHGRHRLLNFWATWCAPCRREIPVLKAFQTEQGDDGILVMGIAVDFVEEVARFAEEIQFNYPVLVGEQDAMAVAESSGVPFVAMPFTMIVARDGEFLAAYLGELHRKELNEIDNILGRLDAGDFDANTARKALERL